MQVFANGEWRFYSFIKFYVIHLNNQEFKFHHSSTFNVHVVAAKN